MDDKQTENAWYVVHTQPQREWYAIAALEQRLHLQAYIPEVLQPFRSDMRLRPLFPCYVFLQANLRVLEVTAVNSTPGVHRMVAFGDRPLPLGDSIVEAVKQEVARVNAQGGLVPAAFLTGEQVRLIQGPLKGLHAVFVRHLRPADRVVVLLEFLGQENEVKLAAVEIERASTVGREFRKQRGTRGKGRKINYKDDRF